jgi:hypothetical protein
MQALHTKVRRRLAAGAITHPNKLKRKCEKLGYSRARAKLIKVRRTP